MNQKLREKIALIAFIIVLIGGLAGSLWYNMNAGHQWNVAATRIDDAAGKMTGYTTIAFDGVAIPTTDEASSAQDPVSLAQVKNSYIEKSSNVMQLDLVHPEKYTQGMVVWVGDKRVGVFYAPTVLTQQQIEDHVSYLKSQHVDYTVCITPESSYIDTNAAPRTHRNTARNSNTSNPASSNGTNSTSSSSAQSEQNPGQNQSQSSQDQASSTNSSNDPSENISSTSNGAEPQNSSSSSNSSSQSTTSAQTDNQTNGPSGETGIDVVITMDNEQDLANGRTVDNTFFVSAPTIGKCGIVVISPYNVVSSDVIDTV